MNRAQKNAWFGLVNCLLAIGFFVVSFLCQKFACVPGFRFSTELSRWDMFKDFLVRHWQFALLAFPVIALILLLIPRKKQSPAEPDFDELDSVIQNKATRVAFIFVWLLWPLTLILTIPKLGDIAPPVAAFCVFIYLAIFIICMAIYFLTKVLLYRKHTEGATDE